MNIAGVPAKDVAALWPKLEWHFRNFEERSGGRVTAGELIGDCIAGRRQCWVAGEDSEVLAVMITEIQSDRVQMTFCNGRDREKWQNEIVDEIRRWAKHIGAKKLEAIHRPGWTKFLKGKGFKPTHYMSEVDL